MQVICSSEESLYRPEVERWRNRMLMMEPKGDVVVLLPCSMKKPYSNSKSHHQFRKASKSFQELIITSPFGICPRELENTFPIQSYDVTVSGDWSFEEIKLSGELLKEYVKDKTVVANLSGGYEEVCRNYLDECVYTCEDGRPTSPDSIYNLRMELKNYNKIPRKEKVLHELRSIATYQFGENGDKFIPEDVKSKGRYHRKLFSNNEQIALLNRDIGLYSLNLEGGKLLFELGINIVNIDFDLKTNTVFTPGISKADHNIIPQDEVVVVNNDKVVGVGKAVLTGREMEACENGVGVKIRHRLK
jgi:archaeosine synthase alpha-subunit